MVNIRVLANAKLSNSYPGVNVSVKLGSSVLPHHLETLARNIWLNFHDDKNNSALSQYRGHMAEPGAQHNTSFTISKELTTRIK